MHLQEYWDRQAEESRLLPDAGRATHASLDCWALKSLLLDTQLCGECSARRCQCVKLQDPWDRQATNLSLFLMLDELRMPGRAASAGFSGHYTVAWDDVGLPKGLASVTCLSRISLWLQVRVCASAGLSGQAGSGTLILF